MKIYELLGGNKEELFFNETEIRFLIHKSLISEETRTMIERYIASLRTPKDINITASGNIRIFTPSGIVCSPDSEKDDYLWYAL